jgi:hypothetical protein
MITTVTLGAITLKCSSIEKPKTPRTAILAIPGRDGDIIQNMGNSSKFITLQGILSGAAKDTDKITLEDYRGTTQTYNDGIDNITVYVADVNIPTVGGQPNHYNFSISLIEYSQT